MSSIAIQANEITKIYHLYKSPQDRIREAFSFRKNKYGKDFFALNGVSFKIEKGECVGIIGRNGSGKSTLLKILTGVLTPTHGEIDINGRVSAILELGAGFNMEYTGIENIYMNGAILGYSKEEMDTRLQNILEFADIGEFVYQPVKSYSTGMFVRLAFAVAINVEPDILIIDEALAVGDTRFQLKCLDKFKELQSSGITILFVSHDINAIKRFCNRAIWINEGLLKMHGTSEYICDAYMDFLKEDSSKSKFSNQISEVVHEVNEIELEHVDIAQIKKVCLLNDNDEIIERVMHGQNLNVEVKYLVSDISIKNPVIGVAVFGIDGEYICGLNTLLDNHKIAWDRGENKLTLNYHRFNLSGGTYYLDVAIFDETATVPIDYRSKYLDFFVDSKYNGEGVVILNHSWSI